jgi:hypothetical protein
MVNHLKEDGDELVRLDYSDLLAKTLTVLRGQKTSNPFTLSSDRNRLLLNLDEIAFQVATSQIENPLGTDANSAKAATINFNGRSRDDFFKQVRQIRDFLKELLKICLAQEEQNISIEDYVETLVTSLTDFQGEQKTLSFIYPFDRQYCGLQKQQLNLQKKTSHSHPLLKFHKLTITVKNTHDFSEKLRESLENFIALQFSQNEHQELNLILDDLVEDPKSDFYRIKRLMDTEVLGKLQKSAKIHYLEFLKEHLGDREHSVYLEDFIRRLKLIEEYINDLEKDDGYYTVNYAGISVNYREFFARAEALDRLPIIPIIEGFLGETENNKQDNLQFIFGLKLKLNGKVQTASGNSVLDYNLNFLDPDSDEHKEGLAHPFKKEYFVKEVLKIAFLYYFIFACNDPSTEGYTPQSDLDYDPKSVFEEKVLEHLKTTDEEKKRSILRGIKNGIEKYKVSYKIEKIKHLLVNLLQKNTCLPLRTYPLHINLKQGILERDIKTIDNNNTFFKPVLRENPKAALKYISVDSPSVDTTSLCTLAVNLQISDIQYFSTEDSQSFSMEYDLRKIFTIPVLLVPQETRCQSISQNIFPKDKNNHTEERASCKKKKLIEIIYKHERLKNKIFNDLESPQAFIYKIVFALLIYISLKILLDSAKYKLKHKLFVPILRLHLTDRQNFSPEEIFMRSCFSVLSHLLNEEKEHRSNSQGFCIKNFSQFKINNALSSLYSILPKKFKFSEKSYIPKLERLAIIVVSSRECDRSKKDDYKIANLFGEVIGIQREQDGTIRLYTSGTFSGNYNSQEIYTHPDVLIDEFERLYQQGYRHFLYIAKSPYSSTLNMTRTEEEKELFFMSKTIIRSLKGEKEDIKIYPIFFDKYYAIKLANLQSNSLYVRDTLELTNLVKDPSKKTVVFFNLFNGITVPGEERYYNGVISYATLLNIYEGILDDTDIHLGLIDDNNLKNDILNYLTLFHFSRYEAAPTKNRNVSLKLDPYQNIIGFNSVGALSVFNHMTNRVQFNSLAFLTEVRKALNIKPESKK